MKNSLHALIGLLLGAVSIYLAFIVAKAFELIWKVGWETRPLIFFRPQSAALIVGAFLALLAASIVGWLKYPSDSWLKLFTLIAIALLVTLGAGFATSAFALTRQ